MALIGVHYQSAELGKLAHDFAVVEGGLVPRMKTDVQHVGVRTRDLARQRIVGLSTDRQAHKRLMRSAGGVREAHGILEAETGVYTTVGQTIPRVSDPTRQRPTWTKVLQDIIQESVNEDDADRAISGAAITVMKQHNL